MWGLDLGALPDLKQHTANSLSKRLLRTFVSASLDCLEKPRQVADSLEIMRRIAHGEIRPRKRTPQSRHRSDAGGIAGFHVIDGVADEHGVARLITKRVEGEEHGARVRFVLLARVAADDHIEVRAQANVVESALCQPGRLARDDPERMASGSKLVEGLDNEIVAAH